MCNYLFTYNINKKSAQTLETFNRTLQQKQQQHTTYNNNNIQQQHTTATTYNNNKNNNNNNNISVRIHVSNNRYYMSRK